MSITAIILAAGKGTRMNSDLPKVLHKVCGRPMLAYVFDACLEAGCDRLIAVCGHQAEKVRAAFAGIDGRIAWVEQVPQLGTGHAVMVCKDELAKLTGQVLVVAGDGPLLRGATLKKLLDTHARRRQPARWPPASLTIQADTGESCGMIMASLSASSNISTPRSSSGRPGKSTSRSIVSRLPTFAGLSSELPTTTPRASTTSPTR